MKIRPDYVFNPLGSGPSDPRIEVVVMSERARLPIAFALPIGGGWAHFCAECVAVHRADLEASGEDPAILADAEPVFEFSSGTVPCCEICNRVSVESAPFVDVAAALEGAVREYRASGGAAHELLLTTADGETYAVLVADRRTGRAA